MIRNPDIDPVENVSICKFTSLATKFSRICICMTMRKAGADIRQYSRSLVGEDNMQEKRGGAKDLAPLIVA
jgi:hypothetical protein